jgi:hypothetical protein
VKAVAQSARRWDGRDGPLIFYATWEVLLGVVFVGLGLSGGVRGWSLWFWSTLAGLALVGNAAFHWLVVGEVLRRKG